MAYQVDKFNGQFLTSVEDGTIDTTTDLRLVGKNYAGYGEVQNENFLHLLENFANTTQPPKAVKGQVWFDSANAKLKFYDGGKWKAAGGAEVSATAPSGLAQGDFWWDSSAKQLYAWAGSEFILVGPEASPDLGSSGVTAQVVKDSGNTNHSILRITAGGKVMAIVSQTEFTLNTSVNPIDGFTLIKKGLTLVNTSSTGITSSDHYYWGTSSSSLGLIIDGSFIQASEFLRGDNVTFENLISFLDSGLKIGDQSDLKLFVENENQIRVVSQLGNPINFRIVEDGLTNREVANINVDGIYPGDDNVYTLGRPSNKWKEVYGVDIFGNLTGNVTGNLTGNTNGSIISTDGSNAILVNGSTKQIGYAGANILGTLVGNVQGSLTGTATNASALNSIQPSASVPASGTSIPVRDSNGDIYATTFQGVATRADRIKIDDSATDSDPNYKTAKTTATANTITARDGSGNILANLFQGTATAARYADLAEKYLTDAEYEVGTVVAVGGAAEVTKCQEGNRALGVISESPAFMMNTILEGGQYIALKGRVPVKISGSVSKGDRLVAAADGTAKVSAAKDADVFAIALEASTEGVDYIEAVVL